MMRKHIFKDKNSKGSIRWRLQEPTRLEAFSDAVFAFALTLVVISLEVPQTFAELKHNMKGFIGFAVCFTFIVKIWQEQYVFFRRFGLQDNKTMFYNMALLFMVIYFVYPLKFLFYTLSQGFNAKVVEHGVSVSKFDSEGEICELMIIFGVGYVVINLLMALMYAHAIKKKKEISLNLLEVYNAKTDIISFYGRVAVAVFSLATAITGIMLNNGTFAFFSGISYSLIGLVVSMVYARRNKKITSMFSQEMIDEVVNEVVIIEEVEEG